MEYSRIQRLILAEYRELLEEVILVESPFAETTRDGQGVREVALALTNTRLIVAEDVLKCNPQHWCLRGVDAFIETLELVSMYPLNFTTLSIFRKRHRKTIKARFSNGRITYYELGGMGKKTLTWTLWCKNICSMLDRKRMSSSLSEASAAASSTCASTEYKRYSDLDYDSSTARYQKNRKQSENQAELGSGDCWARKNSCLGSSCEVLRKGNFTPLPVNFVSGSLDKIHRNDFNNLKKHKSERLSSSSHNLRKNQHKNKLCNVLLKRKNHKRCVDLKLLLNELQDHDKRERGGHNPFDNLTYSARSTISPPPMDKLDSKSELKTPFSHKNRNYPLKKTEALKRDEIMKMHVAKGGSSFSTYQISSEDTCLYSSSSESHLFTSSAIDPHELIESGVSIWESAKDNQDQSPKRNLRRYGISTATYFLNALGPWAVHPGDRESLQNRRSRSFVSVRRQPAEKELRLPISRRHLSASISVTDFNSHIMVSTPGPVILFWTPDYWYRPKTASNAYQDIRKHLHQLKEFRAEKERSTNKRGKFDRRTKRHLGNHETCGVCSQSMQSNTSCILNRILSNNITGSHGPELENQHQNSRTGTTAYLRKLLKLEYQVTLWDFDSTTLAKQVTLIDRELFIRIPKTELEILIRNRTSRDAPNFGAWIAFAHRISCLTASEILSMKKVEMRARLIARLLNSAKKCLEMSNFHSARSIIAGLQTPAIYRLRDTWNYLKIHHATKYDMMADLCKIFKSTDSKEYRKAWLEAEQNSSLIPFIGDIFSRLLNLVNDIKILTPYSRKITKIPWYKTSLKKQLPMSCKKRTTQRRNYCITKSGIHKPFSSPSQSHHFHSSTWSNRRLNLKKIWNERKITSHGLQELTNWFERCQNQAQIYRFSGEFLAWEFLLKARYREDKDNFFLSLQLELPSET